MNVLTGAVVITAQNSFNRVRKIFIWILKKAGPLLLRLPLASIRFLAQVGNFLLDSKNRKAVMVLLITAGVLIVCRTLVNRANRRRIARESNKLFSKFHSRFTSRLNLADADDEELLKAAWDLEQYFKARHMTVDPRANSKAFTNGLKMLENRSEQQKVAREERLTEIESTLSGHSHEVDLRRLTSATKALSSRPSIY